MSWSTTLKNRHQVRNQMEAGQEIAVMFSDIRGFTSYTARRGDHAAYQLSQLHTALLKERIEEQDGFIVKTLGDGIMAAYPSATKSIQAAVNIQQEIRERNKASSEDPIDIGIGLATGRPIMSNFDMIGHSVNVSQRVSSLAKGGQILVTEQVRQSTPIP
ncbi:adenylate/guanylate cyclase domain-containing protein, partial [Candidatus Bipolaricaulota bacterium]|nr:adenylate/guanylate cyclase domain-containing protein [Candidatus Bipolaricaulota bacterium]